MTECCFWVVANEVRYEDADLLGRLALTFGSQRPGQFMLTFLHTPPHPRLPYRLSCVVVWSKTAPNSAWFSVRHNLWSRMASIEDDTQEEMASSDPIKVEWWSENLFRQKGSSYLHYRRYVLPQNWDGCSYLPFQNERILLNIVKKKSIYSHALTFFRTVLLQWWLILKSGSLSASLTPYFWFLPLSVHNIWWDYSLATSTLACLPAYLFLINQFCSGTLGFWTALWLMNEEFDFTWKGTGLYIYI